MMGGKKYLGIEFTTEGMVGGGSRLKPKRGSQSGDLRTTFISRFEGGVRRKIDVVRETATSGATATLEVLVDEDYAGKVFDVAQKLILESEVDIWADTSQASALASSSTAGEDITVNPNLIDSTYIHEALAGTYDGFWVMLHELFHRAQNNIFEDLAAAQNETILKGSKESEKAVHSDQTNAFWRVDPPNEGVGVHESFVNILRFGYGLRERTMYGDPELQDKVVSAETTDMFGRNVDPPVPFADTKKAVVRAPRPMAPMEEHRFVDDLLDFNGSLPSIKNTRELWATRLLEQSKLKMTGQIALQYADLDLEVNEAKSAVSGASFSIVLESNEATVVLGGRWHPGYTPRFGQLSFAIKFAGVQHLGLGSLETASSFCDMATGAITGEWTTYLSSSSSTTTGSGNWVLSLGAFSSCEL